VLPQVPIAKKVASFFPLRALFWQRVSDKNSLRSNVFTLQKEIPYLPYTPQVEPEGLHPDDDDGSEPTLKREITFLTSRAPHREHAILPSSSPDKRKTWNRSPQFLHSYS
jgi:hypothetical protein